MTILLRSLALVTIACALTAGLLFYHINYSIPATGSNPAEVRVEPGDTLAVVTRKLRAQNIINNGWVFSLWARWRGAEKRIHRGLYRFNSGMAPREVLERLITGKGVFNAVTVPEGLNLKEIAALLDKLQVADQDKFLQQTADPSLLAHFGLQDKGFEGYLFPSTYYFTPATSEREILATMAEQFRKVSLPLLIQRSPSIRLTTHEILTLASIIEKETGVADERALVSAVFYNRLKKEMPLQSDPTVIYGIKDFNGNLTRKNLHEPSPYNTYRIAALPPGPICNPSIASIKAALQPAAVPYLYFVSKNDGTHLFSETIEEHNRAVKIYQPVRIRPQGPGKVGMRK